MQEGKISTPPATIQLQDLALTPVVVKSQSMNFVQQFLALERHLFKKERSSIEWQQETMRALGTSQVQFQFNLWRKPLHLSNNRTLLFPRKRTPSVIKNAVPQHIRHGLIGSAF